MWSGVNTSAPGTRHIFAQCGRDLKFLAVFLSVRRRQCSKQRTLFCYYVRVYKGVDLIYSIDREVFARRRREKEAAINKRLQGMSPGHKLWPTICFLSTAHVVARATVSIAVGKVSRQLHCTSFGCLSSFSFSSRPLTTKIPLASN